MTHPIVVKDLGKRFRRYHADAPVTVYETLLGGFRKLLPAEIFWCLRGVNFEANPGSMIGIVGRNGAGKSTFLRLIAGVGCPDEGTITINGRLQALLTLGAGFHPELTGRENLLVNGVIGGLTRQEVNRKFDSILAFSELEKFIDSPLRTYSTGMQMRLAFSIAIHSEPEILLIDEVLAVGDVVFQKKCMERINDVKARGCTIVLVSHDVGVVRELCDEALWLRQGMVAARGTAGEVVDAYLEEAEGPGGIHANPLTSQVLR